MVDAQSGSVRLLPVVALALTRGDGRVLMARRRAGAQHGGLWEFPGGKIEPGERPEAALVREIAEELGIAIEAGDLVPIGFASEAVGDRHLILLLFGAHRWTGEPKALDADAIEWVLPSELQQLAMPPADRPLAALIASRQEPSAQATRS